jgi:hypothetical protein
MVEEVIQIALTQDNTMVTLKEPMMEIVQHRIEAELTGTQMEVDCRL